MKETSKSYAQDDEGNKDWIWNDIKFVVFLRVKIK